MKKILIYFVFLSNLIFLINCNRDEIVNPPINPNTSEGAYVLAEGGFTPGTSKLSFYNLTKDSFYTNIFNPGSLGITPDGLIIDNNNLYITEQGNSGAAGKIYKTDTNGTVLLSNDVGTNPYSLAHANNKLYVTNGPANNVSVVDKNSLSTITTIIVGIYPQEILAIGNKVFVCNTNLFGGGTDSTVSVIDANIDQVVMTIVVKKNPTALAITPDGKLLVGCPGDSVSAVIYKIDPVTYIKLDSFTNLRQGFCKDIAVNNSDNIIYIGGNIYSEGPVVSYNISSKIPSLIIPKPATGFNYGLQCDSKARKLYVGFTNTFFNSSGRFQIYDLNGLFLKEFTITGGIAPRRIVLKLN